MSKTNMQENLKKAFMRGVCALNFEAMNILQPSQVPSFDDLSQSMGSIQQPNMQQT